MKIFIFLIGFTVAMIGINQFIEDTNSSYLGLKWLEAAFGIKPASLWDFTYVTMSLAPQVGQIIFLYIYYQDRKKNMWALVVAIILMAVDFGADVQERSNGYLTIAPFSPTVIVASILTFGYFTIGSEVFITAGFAVMLATFNDALNEFLNLYEAWLDGLNRFKKLRSDIKVRFDKTPKPSNNDNSKGGRNRNIEMLRERPPAN